MQAFQNRRRHYTASISGICKYSVSNSEPEHYTSMVAEARTFTLNTTNHKCAYVSQSHILTENSKHGLAKAL